uniref:BPI1 domain-containing protein n=1 Tax=Panagrellus redivivus TaxID=6233 RepID=A0A7E4ULL5_PANRE
MLFAQLTLILVFHRIKAIEIAREVEGGVELLSPGKIELILPEEPSFTIKSPGSFIGKAKMCYAAQTTINKKQVMKKLSFVFMIIIDLDTTTMLNIALQRHVFS